MKQNLIEKLKKNNLFVLKNGIFLQKQDSISMYEINKKEQNAMDSLMKKEKQTYKDDLSKYFHMYSETKIIEKNKELIRQSENGNLAIDCGCGGGQYLSELSSKNQVVIAIDVSLEAVKSSKILCKGIDNIIFINGSMLDLHKVFNEPVADFCLSSEVIEHVPSPDIYLNNIYKLLKRNRKLLISTPCQNLYFYPLQFLSMLLTKPQTLYRLLHPLEHWEFALHYHPAMSKKVFLRLLGEHGFKVDCYGNFVPYYFNKFPFMYYFAKILPKKYSLSFYKNFLETYNTVVEKIGFGIRQHALLSKI